MKIDSNSVKKITAVNHGFVKVEEYLMSACTITLVGAIFIEVVCRYFLYISTAWSEEISRYLFIWLTYIGSAYAINTGGHIEIDIFRQILEKSENREDRDRRLKKLDIVAFFTMMVFLIVFNKVFFDYMIKIWKKVQTSPTMHIPMGLVYLPVFISNILGIGHCILNILILTDKKMDVPASREGGEQ